MRSKNLRELPKIRDSLSYAYFERARIERNGSAVSILDQSGELHVPTAALGLLMLGPGTAITHEAMKVLCESGCSVLWVGEQGVRMYGQGLGETRSARRLLRQAELHGDPRKRAAVVLRMYEHRFGETLPAGLTIEQVRGREGVRVRTAYSQASEASGVAWRGRSYDRRNWKSADPINRALSAGASCLYGICHSAIVAAGYSPALGFVHTGKLLSFVYDIADLYRVDVIVPVAFEVTAAHGRGEVSGSLESGVRLSCRDAFREHKLLKRIVKDLDSLMRVGEEQIEAASLLVDGEDDAPGGLWDPNLGVIEGGRNHDPHSDEEGTTESEG